MLTSLVELRLQNNKLAELPVQLAACKRMRSLNAGKNNLTSIAAELLQSMTCLRELHLYVRLCAVHWTQWRNSHTCFASGTKTP